jgi:DNA-directed RNA polymerase specialized sigma24 family protein
VEYFAPRLASFFRARAARLDVAEELTQETLLAGLLALRAGRLRAGEAMEAFVLGIARRQLAEAFRTRARHPNVPGADLDTIRSGAMAAPELTLTVRGEFEELASMDQQILWSILVEGCRPAEVAGRVGLSEEAVRQRKSRALRRLAEKLTTPAVTDPDWVATLTRRNASGDAA